MPPVTPSSTFFYILEGSLLASLGCIPHSQSCRIRQSYAYGTGELQVKSVHNHHPDMRAADFLKMVFTHAAFLLSRRNIALFLSAVNVTVALILWWHSTFKVSEIKEYLMKLSVCHTFGMK